MARKPKRHPVQLKAGDIVLIGHPRHSKPGDWFFARVLWTDGTDEMLTEHAPPSQQNELYRQVLSLDHVRGIADSYGPLILFREKCQLEVDGLTDQVLEAERALGLARDAVWARIAGIGAATPPDHRGDIVNG